MRTPRSATIHLSALAHLAFIVAVFPSCSDRTGPLAPTDGALRVVVATTGADLDPDGFTVAIDSTTARPIGVNDALTFTALSAGSHSLSLAGLAANCTPDGDSTRSVTVMRGDTIGVAFAIACTALTGIVAISVSTTGLDLDPDGYTLRLDDGTQQAVGINATVLFNQVSRGKHLLTLAGAAGNCSVAGNNPDSVTVTTGTTTRDTARTTFTVTCTAVTETGQIAFVAPFNTGSANIHVMNADGSGVVQLTNTSDPLIWNLQPAWSPDGTKLAFVSNRDDVSSREIYVMNADGSGVVRLTNNTAADGDPAWSPDGTRIAFTSGRDGHSEIYVMNADGSGAVRLTTTDDTIWNQQPDWSPDGSKIAFASNRDGNARLGVSEIYVMNADGSGVVRFTNTSGILNLTPAWSPDGTKIAFTSSRDGTYQIYVMSADGSNVTRLTGDSDIDEAPAWSPNGSTIAFTKLTLSCLSESYCSYVYTVKADGGGLYQLPGTNSGGDWDPAWRP
jgi:Tol biopolymer transport system component